MYYSSNVLLEFCIVRRVLYYPDSDLGHRRRESGVRNKNDASLVSLNTVFIPTLVGINTVGINIGHQLFLNTLITSIQISSRSLFYKSFNYFSA